MGNETFYGDGLSGYFPKSQNFFIIRIPLNMISKVNNKNLILNALKELKSPKVQVKK